MSLPKCHSMASCAELRGQFMRAAASEGAEGILPSEAARDPGHDTTFGMRRSVKVRKDRFAKGGRRSLRLSKRTCSVGASRRVMKPASVWP